MSRFTTKIDNEYIVGVSVGECGWTDVAEEKQYEANQKLGKLEDLEEQLGCPLEVVIKAIIQNCIYMGFLTETEIGLVWEDNEPKYVISVEQWENGNQVELKDYKKTWWLREDMSE